MGVDEIWANLNKNKEEAILTTRARKKAFAKKVANYVDQMDIDFDERSSVQAAAAAIYALSQDMGMAQDFLTVIGVDLDLYNYDFNKKKEAVDNDQTDEPMVYEISLRKMGKIRFGPDDIKTDLIKHGFDLERPIIVSDDWDAGVKRYVQSKEVSNADRAERTPDGSDQVSIQWEDPLRGRREWKDSNYPGVLHREGNPP